MSQLLNNHTGPSSKLFPFGVAGLICSQVLVSAGALILEIIAGRILAPYVGMSVYTWTAVIAVVLAGLSLGHWVGGRIAEAVPRIALGMTAATLAAAALTSAATIFVLRFAAGPVTRLANDPVTEVSFLAAVVFFAPSFFAGVPSPVIASIAVSTRPDQQGRALGSVFAAGALGAIAGTLCAGYILIAWLGTTASTVLVSMIYAVIAALFAIGSRDARLIITTAFLILVSAVVCVLSLQSPNACKVESRYYCIRVVDVSDDVGMPSRLMVLDHLGHGISVKGEPTVLVMPYVAMIDAVIANKLGGPPQSAFFIGGGAYTLPRAWAHKDVQDITVAEIDPHVTQVAVEEFWLDPNSVTIHHDDARRVLRQITRKFQIIVGDAFTDIAVPHHLVTREFFLLIQSRLTNDGIYAMNIVDDANRGLALSAVISTLKTVFKQVEVFVESSDLQGGGRTTFVVFASASASGIQSLQEPGVQNRQFINLTRSNRLGELMRRDGVILTDDYAPIDRLIGLDAM